MTPIDGTRNPDWRFPRAVSGIEHGRWENFDEHGCRCGACVKAWQEHGREIEQVVASDKVGELDHA